MNQNTKVLLTIVLFCLLGPHAELMARGFGGGAARRQGCGQAGKAQDGKAQAGKAQGGTEILGDSDLLFEFMLNALRLVDGFREQLFAERTRLPIPALRERLAPLATRGLITGGEDGRWAPTPKGQQFLNDLQAHFLPD